MNINELRERYHAELCLRVLHLKDGGKPSMADVGSRLSVEVSKNLVGLLPYPIGRGSLKGQTVGKELEKITKDFLREAFTRLSHVRPGSWLFSLHDSISDFDQYNHLATLSKLVAGNRELKTALGDYVISPDIIVARQPLKDSELNRKQILDADRSRPRYSPLRARNNPVPILHASISCKWTLRSDRSQNARTEGLNLIRNRKGNAPHIVVVTGEPMPSRIASLALGTGDIDCVYHFALDELIEAVGKTGDESAVESLQILTEGRRLRDISEMPFDLAV